MSSKANKIVLDLKFSSSPPTISDRVIGVAEAFGIGVDETREVPIFDKIVLQYNDADLIYVTGDSGSGKSCFLRLFMEHERARGRKVGSFETVAVDPEEIIVNGVGRDLGESLGILSTVGLSEAFMMIRRFKELSDGQKYRYKLAKLIDEGVDVFVIDEFGAALDRVMAKVLAYSFQKWARRNNKQLVIATTHHDLIEDFSPDILVYKPIGKPAQVTYSKPETKPFSLIREMTIQQGTMQDYDSLSQFHYLHGKPMVIRIFKLTWNSQVIGVAVYSLPFLHAAGRSKLFPEYADKQRLNREVRRISRVIIDPKFRGAGLAAAFISQCNRLMGMRVIESLAVMAKYNPFFVKAGMAVGGVSKASREQERVVGFAVAKGFKLWQLRTKAGRKQFLSSLSSGEFQKFMACLIKIYRGKRAISKGADTDIEQLQKGNIDKALADALPTEKVYLYWVNPDWRPTQ